MTLTENQRQTILKEAAELGINPSEYVTMILTLSRTIRKSLGQAESLDLNNILQWASNPLFAGMLSGLLGSIKKTPEKTTDVASTVLPEAQIAPQPSSPAQTYLPPNGSNQTRPSPLPGQHPDPRWSGWM